MRGRKQSRPVFKYHKTAILRKQSIILYIWQATFIDRTIEKSTNLTKIVVVTCWMQQMKCCAG